MAAPATWPYFWLAPGDVTAEDTISVVQVQCPVISSFWLWVLAKVAEIDPVVPSPWIVTVPLSAKTGSL